MELLRCESFRKQKMGRGVLNTSFWFLAYYLMNLFGLQLHCSSSAVVHNITSDGSLSQGQTLTSPGQIFELGFFSADNKHYVGIWYKNLSPTRVVWVANREKPVTETDSSASLIIGKDGNLKLVVVVDGIGNIDNRETIWSININISRPSSNVASIGLLSDEGLFTLKDNLTQDILWKSTDHPSDTLLPGGSVSHVFTSWKSDHNPSLGNFTFHFAPQPPWQAYIWNGSTPYWRTGPWNNQKFIGVPEMDTSTDGVTTLEGVAKNCSFPNLFLSPQGPLHFMCWDKGRGWYSSWDAPKNPCEIYGSCGPFGFCNTNKSLTCLCLKGFVPKSPEDWGKGNWTGGCVRQSKLFCEKNSTQRGNTDVFWRMNGVKLPDFHHYVGHERANDCQQLCFNNCSCLAFAYVNGIGCLLWAGDLLDIKQFSAGGEDLFLRLAHHELGKGKQGNFIPLLVSVLTVAAVLGLIACVLCKWKANQRVEHKHKIDSSRHASENSSNWQGIKEEDSLELRIFDLDSLLVATSNFNVANKLGQGGYGPVYKGTLLDGKNVAIKRLSSSSGQGAEEFKNEIMLISKLQHRNLVRLIGCCIEREEKILIYEFLSNGSLDSHLFDPTKKTELNWAKRFNIIDGIARGLLYLHRDSCLRVIHRDLKVSNILLDEKMNPKISDFGLARMFQGTQDLANTHRVVGTLGYMSPEYVLGGVFSEKSDVFSFGVLLLETVSGKKISNYIYDGDGQHLGLLAYAWQSWCRSQGVDMIDEVLGSDSFSSSEVKRCVNIGLLCVHDHPADRPSMSAIVSMLSSEAELPHPKQPTFTFKSTPNSSAANESVWSINEASQSILEGR